MCAAAYFWEFDRLESKSLRWTNTHHFTGIFMYRPARTYNQHLSFPLISDVTIRSVQKKMFARVARRELTLRWCIVECERIIRIVASVRDPRFSRHFYLLFRLLPYSKHLCVENRRSERNYYVYEIQLHFVRFDLIWFDSVHSICK